MCTYDSGFRVFRSDSVTKEESISGATFDLVITPDKGGFSTVMVRCDSVQEAQAACDLITAALCLVHTVPLVEMRGVAIRPPHDAISDCSCDPKAIPAGRESMAIGSMLMSCEIACAASRSRALINSLHKYYLSCFVCSSLMVDLHPTLGEITRSSPYPSDHIAYAYAIIIAYAIIEELQLEIRATSANPSYLQDGTWNPAVKKELEQRLTKGGIDIHNPFPWDRRGTPTKLEIRRQESRPLQILSDAPWAGGEIRDVEIPLVDAIAYVSWLRSSISSHKMSDDATQLTVYDVSNAQMLARRLVLDTMGLLCH